MFSGESGSGKTSLARIVALSLQGSEGFGSPTNEDWSHYKDYSIQEINASEVGGVDYIAKVAESSGYLPIAPSRRRVIILDEAQRISKPAQNLLLKHFEEAPDTTVWMIATTDPSAILVPLRRRCIDVAMRPLSIKATGILVRSIVRKEKADVDVDEFVDAVLKTGLTSPGIIVKCLEKYINGMKAEEAVIGGEATINTLRICRAVVAGDVEAVTKELAHAVREDVPVLVSSVANYLKVIMLKKTTSAISECWGIERLAEATRVEEYAKLPYVCSIMFQLTKKFQGARTTR
jgi:DNA polymerase III subunit gamma/tau